MEISVLAERSAAAMQLIEPADLQKRAEPAEDPGVLLAVFKRLDSLMPHITAAI
ncbi:hypothetical protein MF271_10490 [Deinococcus sp. KNUC1210]|uniref:hypothetical protein n=1 Tax=Deinococcus sp. KNUC1210 TaxID=2917691 RepID=UPI001EEFE059|nr:hypothetical protein [Deinococcus sp. KNUC1210]ULH14462.1 hypothetical protein MF271_10490 [Deinococcus sp. KNUC1210]